MKPKSLAFTLVELLVVVAIIAILAAILFPVFSRAKGTAHKTSCLSNIRQIGMAWQMYANDNEDTAAPSYYDLGLVAWDFRFDNPERSPEPGLLGPYTRTGELYACPTFAADSWDRPYTGYAYNTSYIGGDVYYGIAPARLSQMERPSGTAVFAEGGFGNPVSAHNFLRAPSDPLYPYGKVHFRHDGVANVAYGDGHAAGTNRLHLPESDQPEVGALSPDDSAYSLTGGPTTVF